MSTVHTHTQPLTRTGTSGAFPTFGEAWSRAALSKRSQVEDKMWISDSLAYLVQES